MIKSTYTSDGRLYKDVIAERKERKRLKQESNKDIYMEMVELVSNELDIPIEAITSKRRKAEIIEARQFVYKLCVLKGMLTYHVSQQAKKTGPTILHNLTQFEGHYEFDKEYRNKFDLIKEQINGNNKKRKTMKIKIKRTTTKGLVDAEGYFFEERNMQFCLVQLDEGYFCIELSTGCNVIDFNPLECSVIESIESARAEIKSKTTEEWEFALKKVSDEYCFKYGFKLPVNERVENK